MADPTADAPSWLTWALGGGGAATMAWGGWQWIMARMQASKAEARTERKAAIAEAAENDIIATLRKQLEAERQQRSDDVALLRKEIAECRKEISDLRGQLDEAFDARVEAMREATKALEQNTLLETRLSVVGAERNSLCASHAELINWLAGLDLPDGTRLSPIYRKAMIWLEHNRSILSGAA